MPRDSWINLVTAVATILAAVVPLWLFLIESKNRKATQNALDAELRRQAMVEVARAEQERLANVRRVGVMPVLEPGLTPGVDKPDRKTGWRLSVVVANRSTDIVYDLRLYVPSAGDGGPVQELMHLLSLGPGESKLAERPQPWAIAPLEPPPDSPRCWIDYTNVLGERWRRYSDGEVRPTGKKASGRETQRPRPEGKG